LSDEVGKKGSEASFFTGMTKKKKGTLEGQREQQQEEKGGGGEKRRGEKKEGGKGNDSGLIRKGKRDRLEQPRYKGSNVPNKKSCGKKKRVAEAPKKDRLLLQNPQRRGKRFCSPFPHNAK